ncbi:phosphoadenosine phosphosulfate reductase family protein [Streptomyces sp. IpFD-1.1]|uniref:phosphoadenosine phosphosulfate reductase domain-containing protein n=1 Tax=unclassified Streptomyces TaxID=2593676 RepID=UPI0014366EA7|nr:MULTISPECIES: phosphoadenosine phosphosulfate reductase family protein [unclassified Streptomyces]MBV7255075.1 phosphoadenosine phosphosulfate reductase family protein [Streptomyces sp. S-2]MCO6748826.1 phosphoadenosine phosphosulfate reductase family protein [Streptomyces sp. IpFD-1.1]
MTKNPFPPACAAGCAAAQMELFTRPAEPAAAVEFDFDAHDVVVVGDSGGKDSGATVDEVCTRADKAGQLHKVRILHCDLGTTERGHLVEWPGALDVARAHATQYGVPFAVRRSKRWGSLWERIRSHGKWPGHFARYCTSDTKTAVGRDYVDEVGAELRLGRPVRAGYAMGMRAEESRARAKKPVLERHRMSGKGTLRVVTTWLPIHHLGTEQVWQVHRENDIKYHEAYDQGMRRLSCRACPLAHTDDLVRSAQLNPELFEEYADAEAEMGHQFKESISLRKIIERARS